MTDLGVRLKAKDVSAMLVCPIPTYLIGVDERAEVAFIVAISGKISGGISSIPTKFPLDRENLKILRDEVRNYWRTLTVSSKSKTSAFAL